MYIYDPGQPYSLLFLNLAHVCFCVYVRTYVLMCVCVCVCVCVRTYVLTRGHCPTATAGASAAVTQRVNVSGYTPSPGMELVSQVELLTTMVFFLSIINVATVVGAFR